VPAANQSTPSQRLLKAEKALRLAELLQGNALGGELLDETDEHPRPAADEGAADRPREFGSYILLEKLGSGGMGDVYRAEHRVMERIVAIKTIRRQLLASPLAVERFHREVKADARLSHPNIVASYDAGEVDGTSFLASRCTRVRPACKNSWPTRRDRSRP